MPKTTTHYEVVYTVMDGEDFPRYQEKFKDRAHAEAYVETLLDDYSLQGISGVIKEVTSTYISNFYV